MSYVFLCDQMTSILEDIFPELSTKQVETAIMYSSGVSIDDIALSRHTSVTSTKKMLNRSMEALNVFSLQSLRVVMQTRLSMFLLQKNVLISEQVSRLERHIIPLNSYRI